MATSSAIMLAKKPFIIFLLAAFAVAAIAVPVRVLAHTPEEGHPTSTTIACDDMEMLHGETTQCLVTVTDLTGDDVTIELAANGTVTCIFTNEAVEDDDPVVEACEGPAAPAIAAAYLKAEGVKPGGPGRINLIAAVATQLGGPHATFDGLTKCDEGYVDAVEAFLAGEIEAQGLGASAESEAEAEAGRGGPPAWVPRGGPPAWVPAGR